MINSPRDKVNCTSVKPHFYVKFVNVCTCVCPFKEMLFAIIMQIRNRTEKRSHTDRFDIYVRSENFGH